MVIKVGINSFSRIGRVIFRTCCQNSEIEVTAINDPAVDLEYICYLIKFDSTHGKYSGEVSYQGQEILVNGRTVKVFHHKDPTDIPWHQAGVQYVVETSGMFTTLEKAAGHLASDTVRRVFVTAPSVDVPMLILGVNEDRIQSDVKVISCASSTIYCLAPIIKVLEETFGVSEGTVTSIHAMTPSLKPLDGLCMRGKHWRDHRSIHQNIIPAATGACRALGKIIPSCKDKLVGLAFRVPIVNVSVLDMSIRLCKNATITGISQAVQRIKNPALRNIIQISNEKSVSSDFMGDPHSCTLDIDTSLQITPHFFKLICWYENEYSYSRRVVETILFSERQFQTRIVSPISMIYNKSMAFKALCKFQFADNIETNSNRQCVPFSCAKLKNSRAAIQPESRNLVLRAAPKIKVNDTPKCSQLDTKGKAVKLPLKSNIDKYTVCSCNTMQDRISSTSKTVQRAKTREFLKTVEKEISAMLTMTEDLLSKSANKKYSTATHTFKETTERELALLRKNIIKKISDTLYKLRKEKIDRIIDLNHDKKSLRFDFEDYRDKIYMHEADSLNNSELKIRKSNISCKIQMDNIVASNLSLKPLRSTHESHHPLHKINKNRSLNKNSKPRITNDLELQISKIYTPLKKGKSVDDNTSPLDHDNVQEKDDTDNEVILIVSDNLEPAIKLLNDNSPDTLNDSANVLKKRSKCNVSISHYGFNVNPVKKEYTARSASVVDFCKAKIELKVEPVYVKVIEDQQKESIEIVTGNTLGEVNCMLNQSASSTAQEHDYNASPGCSSNQMLCHKCSSNPVNNGTKEVRSISDHVVPTQAKKLGNLDRSSSDLYDKLDSTSVSDSDSSYRIHDKKSEIINITDLTYSLEDLGRLDKICRVIEISDELSDKMFSPLDSDNYDGSSRKNWSFRDFCERIKFDEFCNDLFEKSAL